MKRVHFGIAIISFLSILFWVFPISLFGQWYPSGFDNIQSQPIYVHGTNTTGILIWRGLTQTTTSNTGIGLYTLSNISGTGSNNLAIGNNSMQNSTIDYSNIAIGNSSMQYLTLPASGNSNSNSNIAIGHSALKMVTTPDAQFKNYSANNIAIGHSAMLNSKSSLSGNLNTDNIAIGNNALRLNYGNFNTAIGSGIMLQNTSGSRNVALGYQALESSIDGVGNTALGQAAMQGTSNPGQYNIGISYQSLNSLTSSSSFNTGLGYQSLRNLTQGSYNIGIGYQSLLSQTQGNNNVGIGNNAQVASTTQSNQLSIQNVIYGINLTGGASPNNVGNIGIGTIPGSFPGFTNVLAKLEVGGTLKVDVVNNVSNPTNRFLYWGNDGILKESAIPSPGVSSICTGTQNINFVPKNNDEYGNLSCSQIFDNSTSVGINQTSGFGYSSYSGFELGNTLPPTSGNYKLAVNGVLAAVAYYATSDERLKKNIKKINNPIEKINKINGYTYNWIEDNKLNKNLDQNRQAGFLAQELANVIPEAVLLNNDGSFSVNYSAVLPLFVEGMKAQQIEIKENSLRIEELELKIRELTLAVGNKSNSVSFAKLEISPNPITGTSTISYKSNSNASLLLITDLQGKAIQKKQLSSKEGVIQFSNRDLISGIYIFSLVSDGADIVSKKVMIL